MHHNAHDLGHEGHHVAKEHELPADVVRRAPTHFVDDYGKERETYAKRTVVRLKGNINYVCTLKNDYFEFRIFRSL